MKIKKIILLFVVVVLLSLSKLAAQQHYLGIRGGWGTADVRLSPKIETPPVWGALNGAIVWTYYAGSKAHSLNKWLGGISVELEYMQRGFKHETIGNSNEEYRRSVQSIILPFMWQPHIFAFDDRLRIFLNVGATVSYNFGSQEHRTEIKDGETIGETTTINYEMLLVRDNKWGYGLCGGLGAGWNWNMWEISVEGRYYFGFSDILKPKTVYEGDGNYRNQLMRSPLDNIIVSTSFSYHWGPDVQKAISTRKAKRLVKEEKKLLEKEFNIKD